MLIFSNLATSIDGKIATASRAYYPLGTREDRRVMGVLRAQSDAIIVGAGTLRTFHEPMLVDVEGAAKTKKPTRRKKQPINCVVSSNLEGISPKWTFFTDRQIRRILFTQVGTSQKRIDLFKPLENSLRRSNCSDSRKAWSEKTFGRRWRRLDVGFFKARSHRRVSRYPHTESPRW
jgi:riboflavin biosynthesis pyrimidine reductase